MRTIVVDDMGPMRRTVCLTLESLGFDDTIVAKNGKEAFEKIIANYDIPGKKVELAIVDWNMAPVTGLDLLKMTRRDKRTMDIIFVMITAEQYQDNVIAAIQSGVDEYIIKPFTPDTVKDKFTRLTMRKIAEIRKEISDILDKTPAPSMDDSAAVSRLAVEVDKFKTRLVKLFELSRWSYLAPLELGDLFLKTGDYQSAETWLRKAISIDFGAAKAHQLLSQTLRGTGKIRESTKELEIAVVEKPKSGELKQKLGESFLREKNYDKAISLLEESIKLFEEKKDYRKMADSKNSLGQAKLGKGSEENRDDLKQSAEKDLADAVALNPDLVSAHYNLMVAYRQTGKLDEAMRTLERITSLQPKDAQGWIALGKAYLQKGEPSKAKFAFNNADRLSGDAFEVYEAISTALYNRKMLKDALPYLDKAEQINPSDIFPYNLKGIIYRMMDDYESAIKEYEHAVKLDLENSAIHFNLGVAHYKAGHEKESLEYFRTAKELNPDSGETGEYLAKLGIIS